MKFLLDNMVTKGVQKLLQSLGFDVTNLRELGMPYLENGEVHQKANELDRLVMTYDRDFEYIGKVRQISIILIRGKRVTNPHVLPHLEKWLENIPIEQHRDHLIKCDKDSVQITKFRE